MLTSPVISNSFIVNLLHDLESARREEMSPAAGRAGPATDEREYTARWNESPRPADAECCADEGHRYLTRGSCRAIRGPTRREPTSAELDRIQLPRVRW